MKDIKQQNSIIESKITNDLADVHFLLWVTMSRVRYGISRLRETELVPYGISPEQGAVLLVIKGLYNQATSAEIARWLYRRPNTVSVILKSMEKKGLIIRRNDLYAKNMKRIALTKYGEQILQKASERKSIRSVMSVLSEEDCNYLSRAFDKLAIKLIGELGIDNRPVLPTEDWYKEQ
jgi:DNA-binding MarR family transcriptional regulator